MGKTERKKELQIPQYVEFDFSTLNEEFYCVDKISLLKRKSVNERLSSGYIRYNSLFADIQYYEAAIRFLTKILYGIFGTVTREKVANIFINIEEEGSYCSLEENLISIGIKLLTHSNIPRQQKVDILTAIGMHEEFHKRFTIADIKKSISLKNTENFYKFPSGNEHIETILPTKLHGIINNILEDKRIEKLGLEDFPGYVFFFEELRKYALFLHSKKKFTPEFQSGILLDYLLIKILIPELEDEFMEQINLYENGLLTDIKPVVAEVNYLNFISNLNEIKDIISKLKTHIENNKQTVCSDNWKDIVAETHKIYNIIPEQLQTETNKYLDANSITYINIICDLGGENTNNVPGVSLSKEILDKLKEAMSDELKKLEEESNRSSSEIEKMEEQPIKSSNANDPYNIVQIIDQPVDQFNVALYNDAKKDAKNIFNNLGFLDSKYSRFDESYELMEGDIDETELYSIGFGNRHLFEEIEDIPGYELDFGILLDESGSMSHNIKEAKRAVLALLLALKDNSHVNIYCYGHTANHLNKELKQKTGGKIQMYKYYNTKQKFLNWKKIFSARSRSNNADGYAIEKMGEIISESKGRDKILCVVSDGQPNADNYGGISAENHVKTVVDNLERRGIMVIQLCMDYIENSPRMFKHYIQYEKEGKFFENLKKILLTKLQQFSNQI